MLTLAAWLIYQAFTCPDWLCDLVEFPVTIPFGLVYLGVLRVFAGGLGYSPFRNWFFVIPTLIGNSIIFYWLGAGIAKIFSRALKKASAR